MSSSKVSVFRVRGAQLLMLILMTLMQYCATTGVMKLLDCSAAFVLVRLRTHGASREMLLLSHLLHQPSFHPLVSTSHAHVGCHIKCRRRCCCCCCAYLRVLTFRLERRRYKYKKSLFPTLTLLTALLLLSHTRTEERKKRFVFFFLLLLGDAFTEIRH